MKDILDTLRQVREKSKHTVDNRSLKELDDVIQTLEERIRENSKGRSALDYLSCVAKILALVKFLHGDSDIH
ncbi:hypothetical protein ACGVWS_10740 [Enterobacteriaceae bacterium LUAb1]